METQKSGNVKQELQISMFFDEDDQSFFLELNNQEIGVGKKKSTTYRNALRKVKKLIPILEKEAIKYEEQGL